MLGSGNSNVSHVEYYALAIADVSGLFSWEKSKFSLNLVVFSSAGYEKVQCSYPPFNCDVSDELMCLGFSMFFLVYAYLGELGFCLHFHKSYLEPFPYSGSQLQYISTYTGYVYVIETTTRYIFLGDRPG